MTSTTRSILALAFAGGLAFGGYLLLSGGQGEDDIGSVGFELDDVESVSDDEEELAALEAEQDEDDARITAEASDEDAQVDAELKDEGKAELTLVGRVVSKGSAIANAEVALFMRRDLETFFRNRRGRGTRRGGRDRNWMDTFRLKRVAKTVKTGPDGKFRFTGPAYASSTIEVGVKHDRFAPATVRRDWSEKSGELDVGDIEVARGAMIFGRVIAKTGQPLEGVELRWLPQSSRRGGGRRGGPRGRDFWRRLGNGPLDELIGRAKTSKRGGYELGPVPLGSFKMSAKLERYLDGESEEFEAKTPDRVDAGTITLTLGSELSGIVVDARGKPIADARVRGRASTEEARQRREAENERGGRDRGGRDRSGRSPWANFGDRGVTRETKTGKDGRFSLNALPLGAVRLDVSHPLYIDERKDPIAANSKLRLEIRLVERTKIAGVVLDARTGQPIENFGIAARKTRRGGRDRGGRDRGGRDRGGRDRGGRDRRTQDRNETQSAEAQARDAERTARRRQEEEYRARYFGPSGEAPQRRPKPDAHADGRFVVDKIDRGNWMLDVVAPGYASIADGPIEVSRDKLETEVRTIRLMPASTLRGVVSSSTTRKGVRRASVEIFVPPLPRARDRNDIGDFFRRMFRGGDSDGTRIGRARTNAKGEYAFDSLRPGTYRLVIRARDHIAAVQQKVVVAANRENKRDVVLGVGGTLRGKVRGYKDGKRLRLRHQDNDSARAEIKKDGSYEAKGLKPGSWFVTVEESGGGFGRRGSSMFRQMVSGSKPDVYLQENRVTDFDIDAKASEPATVSGTVLVNGAPTPGYSVVLEAVANGAQSNDPGTSFVRGMASRFLRSTSDDEGRFEVENVPAGTWRVKLSKSSDRGGRDRGRFGGFGRRSSGSAIASMQVTLVPAQSFTHTFSVRVGGLELDLRDKGGKAIERAAVDLALANEAATKAAGEWRELPSYQRLNVRRGIAKVEGLKQGRWSFVVRGAGIKEEVRTIFVGMGEAPVEVFELDVDPAAAKKAQEDREKRRAEREAERAKRAAQSGAGATTNGRRGRGNTNGRRGGNR